MPYKCFADSANVQMICINFKLLKNRSGYLISKAIPKTKSHKKSLIIFKQVC